MKEEFFFDGPNSHRMTIRRVEDVEPIIDEVTEYRNATNNGFSKSKNFRKIGSIPAIIIHQWLIERGIDLMAKGNEKYVRQALNEMTKFRTVDKVL
jgi:hypothetical protein